MAFPLACKEVTQPFLFSFSTSHPYDFTFVFCLQNLLLLKYSDCKQYSNNEKSHFRALACFYLVRYFTSISLYRQAIISKCRAHICNNRRQHLCNPLYAWQLAQGHSQELIKNFNSKKSIQKFIFTFKIILIEPYFIANKYFKFIEF